MNLTENEKRWVVTGVALNKVLLPDFRSFVEQQVQNEYTKLVTSHSIDAQTAAGYLKNWGKLLKYENINGNENHKRGKKFDYSKFDFKVSNHVDLAKLYLLPFMVKFNAFDEHCDASAVLLLLGGVPAFSSAIQTAANYLRDQVRNSWAHANFSVWDNAKFQSSFRNMEALIKTLCLPGCDETELLNKLRDWETKGTILCSNSPVDPQLLKLVQQETAALRADVTNFSFEGEVERKQLERKLEQLDRQLQSEIEQLKARVDRVECDVEEMKNERTNLKNVELKARVDRVECDVEEIKNERTNLKNVELKARVDRVECYVKEIKDKISHLGINKEEETLSFENHFIGVPHRNANFTGREPELMILRHQFQGGETLTDAAVSSGIQHQVLAISGLGGCGKTATAIEYSWLSRQYYSGGVFWLSGESDEMLSKSIDMLTERLGNVIGQQVERNRTEEGSQKEGKDLNGLGQKLNRLLLWLHNRSLPWLVVVDDADHVELTPSMFELLRGSWMRDSLGNILVTSRCKSEELQELLKLQPTNILTLHSMTLQEAIEFLMKRIGVSRAEEELKDVSSLADELGGLPLALEQASVYINVVQCTVKEYLEEYQDQQVKLLKDRKSQPSSEFNTPERLAIHTTWQVNIDHISKAGDDSRLGKAALLMIKISAFLCPDIIPVEVVNAGKPEVEDPDFCRFARKPIRQKQIIDLMTKFSLFEKNQDLNSLSVHRLVQEVIRERCNEDHTRDFVLSCAVKVLHKAFCDIFTASDLWCWFDSFERWNKKMTRKKPKDLPTPSSGGLWIKLAMSSNSLKSHMVKYVSTDNARNLWFTKETARLLRETALYFLHFENYTESWNCHRAMLSILGGLKQNPSDDDLDKLTRKVCFGKRALTNDFKCQFGSWSTSLTSSEEDSSSGPKEIAVTEQFASRAFANGNYEQCCALIDLVLESQTSENVFPCHATIYNYRSAALLKLERFEAALDDVRKWLKCCPDLFTAHERKVHLLCKLAENDLLQWRARARAAKAVMLYKFGENKTCKLNNKFPQILDGVQFVVVFNTEEWMKLDKLGQKSDNSETIYLFTGEDYQIDRIVRTNGCVSFVGLPGKFVELHIKHGVLLESDDGRELQTECMYMMENIHIKNSILVCYRCIFQATECSFEICNEEIFPSTQTQLFNECAGLSEEDLKQSHGLLAVIKMNNVFISNSQFFGSDDSIFTFLPHFCSAISLLRSSGILKDNCITNFLSGIDILCCDDSVGVRGNHIFRCHVGISGVDISNASFSGNKLIFNVTGIRIKNCKKLQVAQNGIMHSTRNALCVSNSNGKVNNNNISSNPLWGLIITSNSNLEIEQNNIVANECGGVRIFMNSCGRVTLQNNVLLNFGPSVCPVEKPPLLEQQLTECGFDPENVDNNIETFYHFAKEVCVVCDRTALSINPPALVNNVTSGYSYCSDTSSIQETWFPGLCCNCCSSLNENPFMCETCLLSRYCGKQCYLSHTEHRKICKSLLTSYTVELKGGNCTNECSSKTVVLQLRSDHIKRRYELWDFSRVVHSFIDFMYEENISFLRHFQNLFGQLEPTMMLATKESFVYVRHEDSGGTCRVFLHEPAPAHLWSGRQ